MYYHAAVLWNVYGECDNWAVMKGHSGAIMELQFSPDDKYVRQSPSRWTMTSPFISAICFSALYTCSTDKSVCKWDLEVCERVKKLKGHQAYVNSVHCARRGPQLLCSGSDDGTIKVCSVSCGD